jgi:hypothetical protein
MATQLAPARWRASAAALRIVFVFTKKGAPGA